MNIKEKVEE